VLPLPKASRSTKKVSFPWPPVVAVHECKRLTRRLHSSGSYLL